jgi:hypothetical protein
MEARALQLSNALRSILSSGEAPYSDSFERLTEESPLQSSNAAVPILITVSGIAIDDRLVQLWNILNIDNQ